MSRCIVKFGGSCLRDGNDVAAILEAVRGYRPAPVIVVSAFRGVTDALAELCERAQPADASPWIDDLRRRARGFVEAAEAHRPADAAPQPTRAPWDAEIAALEHELSSLEPASPEESERRRARILASGERIAAVTLAAALETAGIPSSVVTPQDCGLTATAGYDDVRIDLDASRESARAALAPSECLVVPGYFAIRTDGQLALLGRGGSDYTAAALGALLEAKAVDLWKRGEGFRTADPAIVGTTRLVEALGYDEAAAAAAHGSRILHPRCIEPLRTSAIPLRLFELGRREPRTLVGPPGTIPRLAPVSVLGFRDDPDEGESALALVGERCDDSESATRRMRDALEGAGIACRVVSTAGDGTASPPTVVVSIADRDAALEALHDTFFGARDPQDPDPQSPRGAES